MKDNVKISVLTVPTSQYGSQNYVEEDKKILAKIIYIF